MSTFTGKLGTSDSMPGNVEPGKAPSPPPPPAAAGEQIYPGEVKEGPALHGAPWAIRQTPPVYPMSAPPPAPVRAIYPGEVKQGPFLAGAPWAHFPPTIIPALPKIQNATPIVPQVYPLEVTGGPALHGAPWATRQTPPVYPVQPNPRALPGQVYPGEVRHGPNVIGAPWNHGEPVPPPVYPPPVPPSPPPAPNRGRRGAFVPRVIAPPVGAGGGTKDDAVGHGTALGGGAPLADRTRNHTAKVADVLNSLLGKFEIVHLSAKEYALGAKFIEPRAPTASDDITQGAVPGSVWVDTLHNSVWINVANATGSAIWEMVSAPASSGLTGTFP